MTRALAWLALLLFALLMVIAGPMFYGEALAQVTPALTGALTDNCSTGSAPFTLTGNAPAGIGAGHFLVAFVSEFPFTGHTNLGAPAGWSLVRSDADVSGLNDTARLSVFTFTDTGSAPALNWTESSTSGLCYLIRIQDYTGVASVGPNDGTSGHLTTSFNSAQVIPLVNNTYLLVGLASLNAGGITVTGSPTLNQEWKDESAPTSSSDDFMGDLALAGTGLTTAYTFSFGASNDAASSVLLLDPAPTGSATPTPIPPTATPVATQTPTPSATPTASGTPSPTPTPCGNTIQYISSSVPITQNQSPTTTTIVIPAPSGVLPGDFLLLNDDANGLAAGGVLPEAIPPDGSWANIWNSFCNNGVGNPPPHGGDVEELWYKFAGNSEPSSYTWQFHNAQGSAVSVGLSAFRNVQPPNGGQCTPFTFFGANVCANAMTGGSNPMFVAAGAGTFLNNDMFVIGWGANAGLATFTTPAGATTAYHGGNSAGVALTYQQMSGTGTSPEVDSLLTGNDWWGTIGPILHPAACYGCPTPTPTLSPIPTATPTPCPAPISYRSQSETSGQFPTFPAGYNIAVPAGTQATDTLYMIALTGSPKAGADVATPAGWTEVVHDSSYNSSKTQFIAFQGFTAPGTVGNPSLVLSGASNPPFTFHTWIFALENAVGFVTQSGAERCNLNLFGTCTGGIPSSQTITMSAIPDISVTMSNFFTGVLNGACFAGCANDSMEVLGLGWRDSTVHYVSNNASATVKLNDFSQLGGWGATVPFFNTSCSQVAPSASPTTIVTPAPTATGPTPAPTASGTPTAVPTLSPVPTPTPQPCPTTAANIPLTAVVGNLTTIYGTGAAHVRFQYTWGSLQNVGSIPGSVIPGGSSCSDFTDANGNLPQGRCECLPQNAIMWFTVGSAPPVRIQMPLQPSADISSLVRINTVSSWDVP